MKQSKFKRFCASMLTAAMAMSTLTFAPAASAATTIDPSSWSDWYVYTSYYDANWTSTSAVTAALPADFKTYGGMHPFFYLKDSSRSGIAAEYNNIASINAMLTSSPACYDFSQHIWVDGGADKAEITFLGQSYDPYTDFMLYPTTSTKLKTISFDIDAARIDNHTLKGIAALVNAGINGTGSSATLTGYLVYYMFSTSTSGTVYLQKLNSVNADSFHLTSNPISMSGATSLGTFSLSSGSTKMHIEIEATPTAISIKDTPYSTDKVTLDTSKVTVRASKKATDDTGYYGFGPLVDYVSHGCSSLSYVKFSNLLMTINYSVIFDATGGKMPDGNPTYRVNEIDPGSPIPSGQFPANPTKPGYTFKGWVDPAGNPFDASSPVNGTLTVTAKWEEAKAPAITLTPSSTVWTNKDVVVNVDVKSLDSYALSSISTTGGASKTGLATGSQTSIGTVTFTQNGTLKVDASTPYPMSSTQSLTITNIDKDAPVITSTVPEKVLVTSSDFSRGLTFSDVGGSGINEATKTLYLYDAATSTLKYTIKWDKLSDIENIVAPGKYLYNISVVDNAGNYKDLSGKTADASGTTITPNGPCDGTGKPGTPDDYVIIKGDTPTVVETGSRSTSYTNKDVTVTYEASSIIDLNWVKEAGGKVIPITTAGMTKYIGTLTYTENGSKTVDASNTIDMVGHGTFTVNNIDKLVPTVTMPADRSKFKASDIVVADVPATATQAMSGIASTVYTLTEYRAGKPDPDPRYTYTGTWDQIQAKLVNGATYDITVTATDVAGNTSLPAKATGIIFDDGKPRATLTIQTAGDGTTATNIRFVVSSTGSPITEVRLGDASGTSLYNGRSSMVTLNAITTSGGTLTIYARCEDGTDATGTVQAKQNPSGVVVATFTSPMTVANFTLAFNGATATPAVIQKREIVKTDGTVLTTALLARQPRPLNVFAKFTTTDGVETYFGAGVSGPTMASVSAYPITLN